MRYFARGPRRRQEALFAGFFVRLRCGSWCSPTPANDGRLRLSPEIILASNWSARYVDSPRLRALRIAMATPLAARRCCQSSSRSRRFLQAATSRQLHCIDQRLDSATVNLDKWHIYRGATSQRQPRCWRPDTVRKGVCAPGCS
jgi:hypothetical protein